MRNWAGPLATLGGILSLAFWVLVPVTTTNTYVVAGQNELYITLIALSAAGIVGAFLVRSHPVVAALLMGLGALAGLGALLVPGLLLAVAALLSLSGRGETDVT